MRTDALNVPILGAILPNMGKHFSGTVDPTALSNGLFSATKQKVLALFFTNPDRSFYASEIIERVGAGTGAVQRELTRLVEAGILKSSRRGNQKHYQVDDRCPIHEDLRAIVRKTLGSVRVITDALDCVRDRVRLAILYGSMINGTANAQSDVDLLVVSDDLPLEELYRTLQPAERTLARSIHPTVLSSSEFDARRKSGTPFLNRILSRDHVVVIGSLDDE